MSDKEPVYTVMSPCYELLRYGHDLIEKQTADAHAQGKLSKFVFGPADLIDPGKPPTPDNYRFEARQAEAADVVVYVYKKSQNIKYLDKSLLKTHQYKIDNNLFHLIHYSYCKKPSTYYSKSLKNYLPRIFSQ